MESIITSNKTINDIIVDNIWEKTECIPICDGNKYMLKCSFNKDMINNIKNPDDDSDFDTEYNIRQVKAYFAKHLDTKINIIVNDKDKGIAGAVYKYLLLALNIEKLNNSDLDYYSVPPRFENTYAGNAYERNLLNEALGWNSVFFEVYIAEMKKYDVLRLKDIENHQDLYNIYKMAIDFEYESQYETTSIFWGSGHSECKYNKSFVMVIIGHKSNRTQE